MEEAGEEVVQVKQEDNWHSFPAGLRVLVVDDDPLCLRVVEAMLKRCSYEGKLAAWVGGARQPDPQGPAGPPPPPRPHACVRCW